MSEHRSSAFAAASIALSRSLRILQDFLWLSLDGDLEVDLEAAIYKYLD
jgi:hypothetical protein